MITTNAIMAAKTKTNGSPKAPEHYEVNQHTFRLRTWASATRPGHVKESERKPAAIMASQRYEGVVDGATEASSVPVAICDLRLPPNVALADTRQKIASPNNPTERLHGGHSAYSSITTARWREVRHHPRCIQVCSHDHVCQDERPVKPRWMW